MTKFLMELAGIKFLASVNYESTRSFCGGFIADGEPDYEVSVTADDIARERAGADKQYADEYLETLALYRKVAECAAERDAILFHSSAIAVDGKAYVFTARSGVGKSTHAALWKKLLGERAEMINDDKPLIRQIGEKFVVFGTPWKGKHDRGANVSALLAGICIISRGEKNEIERIPSEEALSTALSQTFCPTDGEMAERVLQTVIKMCAGVPVYKMKCNMDISAAETSFGAMKGENDET